MSGFFPDKELLNEDIIYYLDKTDTKGTISLDLSEYNIPFPKEGVFAGIEFIGNIDEPNTKEINTKIEYTDSFNHSYTFARNRVNGIWSNENENLSKTMQNAKKGKKLNASFSI